MIMYLVNYKLLLKSFYLGIFVLCFVYLFSNNVYAATSLGELEAIIIANQENMQNSLNHIWTMTATALVFLMQAGFLLLETGMVRSKNTINVAQKNMIDFIISMAVFYIFGFSIMFGASYGGWFGWSSDLSFFDTTSDWNYTFFLFQAVFAGTACTIVSGAVSERMKFTGYMWVPVIIGILVYPVVGHWAWGNLLDAANTTYLIVNGFIDFAGSTVVHSVGGWSSLAICMVLGARIGRYNEKGELQPIEGHSLVLSSVGCLILWVGWIGFNGGSTTVGSPAFAHIIFNTFLSACAGGLSLILIGRIFDGYFQTEMSINGILGGLVAVTAGCDVLTGWGSIGMGLIAGPIVYFSTYFVANILKVDDVIGAVPVHGFCGMWGTIGLAFFMPTEALTAGTRFEQIIIQTEGTLYVFLWTFGFVYVIFKIIDHVFGLRVSEEDELAGLNVAEHRASLGIGNLQSRLEDVVSGTKDLRKRIDIEVGDESAVLAENVNRFVAQMQKLMRDIGGAATQLDGHSSEMSNICGRLSDSSAKITSSSNESLEKSHNVSQNIRDIADLSDGMSTTIRDISKDANGMSNSMHKVSNSVEELTRSIDEVAKKSGKTSAISSNARELSLEATETVKSLNKATHNIGDVIDLIKNIAEQTNLLALNATIEASRAGEAGLGFAVVAEEVKALATQTKNATNKITERIEKMQVNSSDVFDIITKVEEIVGTINDEMNNISALTTHQNLNAGEIVENVKSVSARTKNITASIDDVAESAKKLSDGANHAAQTTVEMRTKMIEFNQEIIDSVDYASETVDNSKKVQKISKQLTKSVGIYKT